MSLTFRQFRGPHVSNIPTGQRASCLKHSDRSEGLMSQTFRQVRGPHVSNIPTGQRASCLKHSDRSEGLMSQTFRQVRGPHGSNIPTGQRREARLFIECLKTKLTHLRRVGQARMETFVGFSINQWLPCPMASLSNCHLGFV